MGSQEPFPSAMLAAMRWSAANRFSLLCTGITTSICTLHAMEPLAPYTVDAATLHLWHLDETLPPFADSAPTPVPLRGLLNGAFAGQVSLPGLGSALSFRAGRGGTPGESDFAGAILAESPRLATGAGDNVGENFRYFGPDGAFTYEMLIQPEIFPG